MVPGYHRGPGTGQLAWLPKFGDGALPGSYKIGAWYDTSTADDVVDDINGDPIVLTGLRRSRIADAMEATSTSSSR